MHGPRRIRAVVEVFLGGDVKTMSLGRGPCRLVLLNILIYCTKGAEDVHLWLRVTLKVSQERHVATTHATMKAQVAKHLHY